MTSPGGSNYGRPRKNFCTQTGVLRNWRRSAATVRRRPRAQRPVSTGARLVDECLRFAERSGYTRIVLWTNDVLGAAQRIYTRAGFQLDRQEPHHSFGHDLIGEYWSREL
jgi:GNAT superfamily N-acetyltransferase